MNLETRRMRERRLARERERRRRRRRMKRVISPDEWLKLARRKARRYVKGLSRRQRTRLRRAARQRQRQVRRDRFGLCPVCGKPGGPGHACRIRVSRRNAELMRRRLARQGGLAVRRQDPGLWKRQA